MTGKILKIKINPDPVLRKKSSLVKPEIIKQVDFQKFLVDLKTTMLAKDGAGLAAPQVGINQRVIVLNQEAKNIFMINPKITKLSFSREIKAEGCLSVLNQQGEIYYQAVSRHKWLTCHYLNEKGKLKKLKAKADFARAIQHEVDHLEGILFIDHLK